MHDGVDTAVAACSFTTLAAAGMIATLKGTGPRTRFAPTDEAFAKLPAGTVEARLADIPKLTVILTHHVVAGKVVAADVTFEVPPLARFNIMRRRGEQRLLRVRAGAQLLHWDQRGTSFFKKIFM